MAESVPGLESPVGAESVLPPSAVVPPSSVVLKYVLLPAVALERVTRGPDALVRITLTKPFSDGPVAANPARGPPYWQSRVLRRGAGSVKPAE